MNETLLLEAARIRSSAMRAKMERLRQLEQLVKDGLKLLEGVGEWSAWEERAKALVEQEIN